MASLFESLGINDEEQQAAPVKPEKAGVLRDMAIKGAQGVVDLGAFVVGLGNMVTGGLVGKGMDAIGYDPQRTNATMGEYLSSDQHAADQRVQDADGFFGTIEQAVQEPRFIAGSVMQSLPGLLAMGGMQGAAATAIAGRAALATAEGSAAAAGLTGAKAMEVAMTTQAGGAAAKAAIEANGTRLMALGAASEGAQTTGNIAQEAQHAGRNWVDYAPGALAAGVGTAAIGYGAGKLMGDAGTEIFTGAHTKVGKTLPVRMAKSGISEGVLEEMPQSAQEEFFKNIAMGEDDLTKGVVKAGATGLVTGGAMGVGMGGFHGRSAAAPSVTPQQAEADAIRATELVPEAGAMTRAANVGTEAKARAVESAPPITPEDMFAQELASTQDDIRQSNTLQKMRDSASPTLGVTTDEFLAALSVAGDASARMDLRRMALDNIQGTVEHFKTGANMVPDMTEALGTELAALNERATGMAEVNPAPEFDPNTMDGQTRFADELGSQRAIGGPRALTYDDPAPVEPPPGRQAVPQLQAGDIQNKLGKPFTNLFAAKNVSREAGVGYVPVKLGENAFVVRKVDTEINQAPALAAPMPAATETVATAQVEQTPDVQDVQPAPPAVAPAAKPTDHIGRDNKPLAEGGKPFKTRDEASAARKLQPMLRVVPAQNGKGFALAPKTEAQLAAQDKAAKRLSLARTGKAGVPTAAHEFIAGEGGMDASTRTEFSFGANPRVGNRTLFAGARGGMSIEAATEKLIEARYIPAGASHSDTVALINRSFTQPQYTVDGTEVMAEAAHATRFEDHLAAEQEATQAEVVDPFGPLTDHDFLVEVGYEQATPEVQAEFRALISLAEAKGTDAESIQMDVASRVGSAATDQEYHEAAITALKAALQGSIGDGGTVSGSQSQEARNTADEEGLTAPSRTEVLAQQERTETATKAEAAQRKAQDLADKRARERKDIAKASEAAADTFVLGGDAEQNLSGQKDIFGGSEPAGKSEENDGARKDAATSTKTPSADELRAKADLMNALADLGSIFNAPFKANITPEQEQKLLPVLTRVLDAAFRLGYSKFKDAAKFALEQIRASLGAETADALTLDHLQGAYIAMAGGKQGADTKRAVIDIEDKSEIESHTAQTDNERNGESNAPSTERRVERNRPEPGTQPAVGDAVSPEPSRAGAATSEAGGRPNRSEGGGQQDGSRVPFGSAPVAGERGDQRLHSAGEQPELASIVTGADFREPGGDSGITGVPAESIPASQVDAVADQSAAGLKRTIERTRADKTPVTLGDINNIRATLPQLLPGQQDDVLLAEQRFAKTDGYGMLFTNGTGTGKTFSGLGVIKRFALQGKTNTLIVAPDSKIASDWIDSGKLLGLDVTLLKDTNDAGKGVVITTYANLGENDTLARRQWDLVVADEAHSLMQAADGEPTGYLHNLRAITYHPDGAGQRHAMLNRKLLDQMAELQAESSALELNIASPPADHAKAKDIARRVDALSIKTNEANKLVEADVSAKQGAERTRLVALSATPFAYEKTIDWANGYLFDYNEGQSDESREFRGYNSGGNKDRYMMQHFGYSMRYNKLTRPDANVDGGLMQRQWNANLKRSGALSGRMLDVKPDYDRRFILVESAIGNRIDEALEWISEQRQAEKGQGPYAALSDAINEQFKYLQKRYLLEAIKATEVIPIVKAHLAMGRKVVVFHDYKKGGGFNPFHVRTADSAIGAALDAFNAKFSDLVRAPLGSMPSPIEVFSRELPQTLLINGDEKKSDLLARYKSFQNDDNGPQVMLVQSAKNKGWSGHDTTGKHQRVLINLGQPTAPTLAIQQEGRIYRTGQASDAIMRYMNTGTNWERWTFATTIASRASTAENLGMGEMARALKDSFIQSFEESDTYAPGHEGEGKGGKERDQAANDAITEYDRAKTFYFGQQKKNSRTKAQEGADYFATPEPLGLKMTQWLDARGGEDVLEPSGGHGAIARWLPENTKRTVIEPSLALRSRLSMVMNPTEDRIIAGTFEDHHVGNKYDGIVMNPPFGTAGRTAIDHLAQAATHLRDGGRIVALIPTGPAANKKFDKWFYESSEVPAKPLQTKTGMQKVYAGDTIHFEGSSFIAKSTGKYPQSLASSDYVTDGVTKAHHGGYGVTPGPRTASVNLAEGLQLVANIKLPSITFERAGTAVETRVVVIEKSDRNVMQRDRDLSDITDIKELFDRLEHLDFPTRAKPVEVAPVEAAKAEKPAPAAKPAKAMASAGDQVTMGDKTYPVEIYTTNAGKEKRGVWMDSKSEASKYSARTFTHSSNKGKWFVDEYWFPKDAKVTQADSGVKFSRQETPTRGTPVPRVQAVVDAITANWANAPEVVVVADMQDAKVPQRVREADQLAKSQGAEGEPDGFIYKGTVYLVASELPTINDAVRVLMHESLGHSGLRGIFGDTLKPILNQVAAMRRADIVTKAREYGLLNLDTPLGATVNEQWQAMTEKNRQVAAEEVLAVMAQTHPELGFVKRAVAAIRNWLRTNVPGFKSMLMTDADIIQAFILPARRHIEGGRSKAIQPIHDANLAALSRSQDQTDIDNPDIRYSRATVARYAKHATDKLNETFSHPGGMSLWDKTVGSMYHLAERNPPFKRVFDAAQAFIQDVSFYATEAADLAPKILPKLDTWKDMLKTPVSAADNKAISAPILQGTLSWARDESGKPVLLDELEATYGKLSDEAKVQMLLKKRIVTEDQLKRWKASPLDIYEGAVRNRFNTAFLTAGVVWKDAELQSMFNLNPAQISLYREFRAATDSSLDNLAKADLLRFGGKDVAHLADMVMDAATVDEAALLLRDYLHSQRDLMPERVDDLTAAAGGMIERADKVSKLKSQGYAPLSRFGRYSVDVVVDGKREYFGLFESKAASNLMALKMKQEYGAASVAQGTMSQKEFELFQGITPESLELFGNMLGLDSTGNEAQDQAFQTYLKLTKTNRSAMKRMIHRKGTAGFSEDIGRVLAAFVYSNARQTSAALHMGELGDSVQAIPKGQGELKDAAVELSDYIKKPREEAQALRGLLFAQYLGGSVASAFVNFTQPLTVSFPYLSMYGGAKQSGAALAKAMHDQRAGVKLEDGLRQALHQAEEEGTVSPQSVHELMAQAQGRSTLNSGDGTAAGDALAGAKNNLAKLAIGWGKLFGLAEQINRRSTFIAAYRIAVAQNIANPAAFAIKAVNETQFISNKANKAKFARGAIGATLMTFKSYSTNYLELLHRMATQNGPEGKKAAALMLGMLFLMAGAGGLPFDDDLEDVADGFAQLLGYNFSSKKAKQEFLEGLFGKTMGDFIDKGITGLPGSPIDVSGRMSMGNLIPGTGLLLQKRDHGRDWMEFAGPAGDLATRAFTGAGGMLSGAVHGDAGEFMAGVKAIAPKAVSNALKGADMADTGNYNDDKGYKVLAITPFEAAMKAIGFQPHSVAEVQSSNYLHQRAKDFYVQHAQAINARWAKGIYENDPVQVTAARAMVQSWNDSNPEQPIRANLPAILRRVKEMRKDKSQRIADTAPKAMRAQIKREVADDRVEM